MISSTRNRPWGLVWRSHVWFVTTVVFLGIFTDIFFYAVAIPVVPFRLESLGYKNASALTGWLLFAFSGGLVLSTPPISWFSEKISSRRMPMLLGLLGLIGAQIMFMLAPVYWLMALARVLQGISSTVVWTVGLSLLSDSCPKSKLGQHLGIAMSGISTASVLAPPIGGALYDKLGFHAPFIFSLGVVTLDIAGRMLVIERKDALKWGIDPAAEPDPGSATPASTEDKDAATVAEEGGTATSNEFQEKPSEKDATGAIIAHGVSDSLPEDTAEQVRRLSFMEVLGVIFRSKRALAAIFNALLYGISYTAQEPTFPLRLQDAYGQSPLKVGILYIPIVIPTLLSGFISGKISDKTGSGLICTIVFLLAIPWPLIMIIHRNFALIITAAVFAFFFLAGALTPITTELDSVARLNPGIGFTHVYGAFNMAYGLGSAVGPLIGGQLYDHVENGWAAVMGLSSGICLIAALVCFFFTDDPPPVKRIFGL
ncbi:hypothetical protein M422DRAFT_223517 [Sphaerobolus stellatus SS14]|nr:hypothetical protein M422DRAFT_223517 [Sphaerobolus stellatus SS14]